jgi:cell wall-associated NlpC family hydrolase
MLRRVNLRVNLIILLGLVVVLVLSFGVPVSARAAGSAKAALAIGEKQLGKPYREATDGPKTFSCSGLIRHILREAGVDSNAPWVGTDYLARYERVKPDKMKPGDIVVYPGDHTAMYAGDNTVLNSNSMAGEVTYTDMGYLGKPLGVARPPYTR